MNTINFKDLSKEELKNNNGGFAFVPFLVEALVCGMIYDCVMHSGETSASFRKGFKAGVADY